MTEHVPVTKNEDEELPVPTEWRKPLADIVACLALGEFSKLPSVTPVIPLTDEKCLDIESHIRAACPIERATGAMSLQPLHRAQKAHLMRRPIKLLF